MSHLIYDLLNRVPVISAANVQAKIGQNFRVEIVQSVKDFKQKAKKNTCTLVDVSIRTQNGHSHLDCAHLGFPQESRPEIGLVSYSPSKNLRLIQITLSDNGKKKRFIEIWDKFSLVKSIEVTRDHGDFASDMTFGGGNVDWDSDEKRVLYVAEPFVDTEKQDNLEKYEFKPTWGEKFPNRSSTVIVMAEFDSGKVSCLKGLDNTASQPIFGPGNSVIFRTIYADTRKYGIVYCHNRPAKLFQVKFDFSALDLTLTEPVQISKMFSEARSARISPSKSCLVYLSNAVGGGHFGCSRLMRYDFSSGKESIVVDMVRKPEDSSSFTGLYCEALPSNCWLSDDLILVNTVHRSSRAIYCINLISGAVERISPRLESWTLLDIYGDILLASRSLVNKPGEVLAAKVEQFNMLKIEWKVIYSIKVDDEVAKALDSVDFEIMPSEERSQFLETIIVKPKAIINPNLIMFPHGGPHSAFTIEWSRTANALAMCGYALALVNYTGSIGYGQDSITNLVGQIGTLDIEDVQFVAEKLKARFKSEKVAAFGGSHGGFITGHLVGRYPVSSRHSKSSCRSCL